MDTTNVPIAPASPIKVAPMKSTGAVKPIMGMDPTVILPNRPGYWINVSSVLPSQRSRVKDKHPEFRLRSGDFQHGQHPIARFPAK